MAWNWVAGEAMIIRKTKQIAVIALLSMALAGLFILVTAKRGHSVQRAACNTSIDDLATRNILAKPADNDDVVASGLSSPLILPGEQALQSTDSSNPEPQYPGALEQDMESLLGLRRDLRAQERQDVYDYLDRTQYAESSREMTLQHVLKNDLMERLCLQRIPPEELTGKLAAIYQNQEQSPVVRDYALQHLAFWHEKAPSPAAREEVIQILWNALDDTHSSLAGTALLGIFHIQNKQATPEPDRDRLKSAALQLALSEETAPQARATAVRLCGQMDVMAIHPLIVRVMQSGDNSMLVRASRAAAADLAKYSTSPSPNY